MKKEIRLLAQNPTFKQVLKEWSLQVRTEQDPTMFATMYLEWMRDPVDHDIRQKLSLFTSFMRVREWPEMMEALGPKLDPAVAVIFRSPAAQPFYEGFRHVVIQQIQEYWEEFLKASKDKGDGPREWSPRTGKCSCKKHWKSHGLSSS